jgi:anti-sigma B factor antagonist
VLENRPGVGRSHSSKGFYREEISRIRNISLEILYYVMSKMEIIHSLIEDIPVLFVSGKIDAVTSKDLETALIGLIDQNKKFLVIDMEKVEFLSSSGLRVLMASLNKLKSRDGDLLLAALQPFVKDVFFMTGANRFFPIYASRAEAIKSLQA